MMMQTEETSQKGCQKTWQTVSKNMESFGLSHTDAHNKDGLRLRIKVANG